MCDPAIEVCGGAAITTDLPRPSIASLAKVDLIYYCNVPFLLPVFWIYFVVLYELGHYDEDRERGTGGYEVLSWAFLLVGHVILFLVPAVVLTLYMFFDKVFGSSWILADLALFFVKELPNASVVLHTVTAAIMALEILLWLYPHIGLMLIMYAAVAYLLDLRY